MFCGLSQVQPRLTTGTNLLQVLNMLATDQEAAEAVSTVCKVRLTQHALSDRDMQRRLRLSLVMLAPYCRPVAAQGCWLPLRM